MILLDTNVVSAWLDEQPAESIWTTSITVFEVQTGLELLKPGRRRQQLEDTFAQLLAAVRKASLATRNTRHFEGLGIDIINPWSA